MLGSRRCDLSAWMWDFRSSSHLIPRFGDRPDRSPTRSPRHRITRLPIGASATDAVHQDDVDGQYPQSLMTSRWCPASNMSHWPRLGRGQPPCSCSAHSSTVKCCDTRRDTRLFGYRDTGTCGAGKPRKKRPPTWQPAPSLRRLLSAKHEVWILGPQTPSGGRRATRVDVPAA